MEQIGKYIYPNKVTFKEVLSLAEEIVRKYGGVIPYLDAARKLGHSISESAGIGGWVYKRFDDACMFGLFMREKGSLKATDLAAEALDPYDSVKAAAGKAKAIRNIKVVAEAFDKWSGEVPDGTAFPAKMAELAGVPWQEAQKHAQDLRNLFSELFPYLKPSAKLQEPLVETLTATEMASPVAKRIQALVEEKPTAPYGELRTTVGSVVIKDRRTVKLAKEMLDIIDAQFGEKREGED